MNVAVALDVLPLGRRRDLWVRVAVATVFAVVQLLPILILVAARAGLKPEPVAMLGAAILVGVALLAARHFGPTTLVFGADGLSLRRGGASEYIAGASLRRARLDRGDLVLERRGARPYRCWSTQLAPSEAEALVARLNAAAAAARSRPLESVATFLDRGERSVDGWAAALRQLARRDGIYRVAGPEREVVERVLIDPSTPPARRVAAAVLLHATGEEPARARVRIAAASSVEPDLRATLEDVAMGAPADACLARAEASRRFRDG